VEKTLLALAVLRRRYEDEEDERRAMVINMSIAYFLRRYQRLVFVHRPRRRVRKNRILRHARTIESFSDGFCWKNFKTRKEDLYRLLRAFRLNDDVYRADNGAKFTREEVLLVGLYRYSTAGYLEQTMRSELNLDFSMLSRAFKIFNRHMLENFAHLLVDNLAYWSPQFPVFAECIRRRLSVASEGNIEYAPGTFRVAALYDDTVCATCRPGSGPRRGGGRHNNFIQMGFYNGWKKHHGYKYQSLELPNGMCADLYGPRSFRHNDLELLRDSRLNERLAEIQEGQPRQFCAYGDGIFPILSHTIGKHVGVPTPEERYENEMMSTGAKSFFFFHL
jgi:hypothetical protein